MRTSHLGRSIGIAIVLVIIGAVFGVGAVKATHHLHGPPAPPVAQASAGYGLDEPTSVTLVGQDLYIANSSGDSVTEVNGATGAHVATISGPSYGFAQPSAIVTDGADLFVANQAAGTVTEVDPVTHAAVRTITGFSTPIAMAVVDGELYVLDAAGSVDKVSTVAGGIESTASGPQFGFSTPLGIAASGNSVFVTNSTSNTVTKIDGTSMSLVTVLKGPSFKFATPIGAAVLGGNLWVTNYAADSVTEISVDTDAVVRVIVDHWNLPTPGPITVGDGYVFTVSPPGVSPMVSQIDPGSGTVEWMKCNTNGAYLFSNPQSAIVYGDNLWVVSKDSSSLTQMDSDTGDLIRTIS